ncbi:MAG: response regulator [Candidatus Omnitrophica bacterium]|nr:response regulator [Candidatus Omnitrophota bacterium]
MKPDIGIESGGVSPSGVVARVKELLTSLLAPEMGLSPDARQRVVCIRKEMQTLASSEADLARIGCLQKVRSDLRIADSDTREICGRALEAVSARARDKRIEMLNRLTPGAPHAEADPGVLGQMIGELLNHAIDRTPDGGKVGITAEEYKGGWARICVADTGEDPLSEDDGGDAGRSTDLRLILVRRMGELHGGKFAVHRRPGGGAVWELLLPMYTTHEAQSHKRIDEAVHAAAHGHTAFGLIGVQLMGSAELLSSAGHRVHEEVLGAAMASMHQCLDGDSARIFRSRADQVLAVIAGGDPGQLSAVCGRVRKSLALSLCTSEGKRGRTRFAVDAVRYPGDGIDAGTLTREVCEKLRRPRHILVIDDHPDIRRLVRRRIEACPGLKCLEAADGVEGLESLARIPTDLVICDLMMPRMDGIEFLSRMKSGEKTRHVPFVMLTAFEVEEERIREITQDPVPVLRKTDGFERLMELIEETI